MRTRGNLIVLGMPTVVAVWFVYSFALGYLSGDPGRFGIYWPRHQWLYAHILAGTVALLLGPIQFWLGLNRRPPTLHRVLGISYVTAVAVSGTSAFYLAFHTDFGWMFGMGLSGMATAWMISTAFATIAICRKMVEQHREWMIRSYVVTFGFVTFRVLETAFELAKLGTIVDRMGAAAWLAWSVPLLITEAVLQGCKIFAPRPTSVRLPDVSVYSAVPEPMQFDLQDSESTYQHRR